MNSANSEFQFFANSDDNINFSRGLANASIRILFENQLIAGFSANKPQWFTEVIKLICTNIGSDANESITDKKMEDALIENIIQRFRNSQLQKNDAQIQNVAQGIIIGPNQEIDAWEIFQVINNCCDPAHLTSTKASLIQNLKEKNEIDRQNAKGQTPLMMAVEKGDVQLVEQFLKNRANLEIKEENGNSALMLAVKHDHHQIVKLLMEAGADVHTENKSQITLLITAAQGNFSLVNELIQRGVDLNKKTIKGMTALMCAAYCGQSQIIEALLNANVDESRKVLINEYDNKGFTALMFALARNDTNIAEILIRNKSDLELKGYLPGFNENMGVLQMAVLKKNANVVKALVQAGATLNEPSLNSPLMLASRSRCPEIVEILVNANVDNPKKVNINQCDEKGRTALMNTVIAGDYESFKILINAGADIKIIARGGNFEGDSVLTYLKSLRIKDKKKFTDLMKSPELKGDYNKLKALHQEHNLIKSVGHALSMKGNVTLEQIEQGQSKFMPIPLEMGYPNVWYRLMQKDLAKFTEIYPTLLTPENKHLLDEMLGFAADQKSLNTLERIQQGLPTIIDTGYEGHAVTLFVWGNQIAYCNRGGASLGAPIEFFHFTPSQFTSEILEKVIGKKSKDEFKKLFYEELPKVLNFTRSGMDDQLRLAAFSHLPMQTVSNCSWISAITSIYAFMQIAPTRLASEGKLNEVPLMDPELASSIERQFLLYQQWLGSQQVTIMERLFQRFIGDGSEFKHDYGLFEVSFKVANSIELDPVSKKRLDAITKAYDLIKNLAFKKDVEFQPEDEPISIKLPEEQMDTDRREESPGQASLKRKANQTEELLHDRPTKIVKVTQ